MPDLDVTTYAGAEIEPFLPELAALRIEVFREFPYLYDGTEDYERTYLRTYSEAPDSVFVVVRDEGAVVGVSTALPMVEADPAFRAPFEAAGYDVRDVFYFGESVLKAGYRGHGMGRRFFEEREARARSYGARMSTFCAVERPADHPRRPPDYRPLHAFWNRLGYVRHPELRTAYAWKDLDDEGETPKEMVFWLKKLDAGA